MLVQKGALICATVIFRADVKVGITLILVLYNTVTDKRANTGLCMLRVLLTRVSL
jgi:hypothetical protein